jgi:hypothetical protein
MKMPKLYVFIKSYDSTFLGFIHVFIHKINKNSEVFKMIQKREITLMCTLFERGGNT